MDKDTHVPSSPITFLEQDQIPLFIYNFFKKGSDVNEVREFLGSPFLSNSRWNN